MSQAATMPVPAPSAWTWGPSRKGLGGYGGSCASGPFAFAVSVNHHHGDSWELQASCALAAVTMATHSWEAESLSCTPEGIIGELAGRDVLRQLAETARRRVAEAARLLEEFDVLARAGDDTTG